jgi:hypothetical protein
VRSIGTWCCSSTPVVSVISPRPCKLCTAVGARVDRAAGELPQLPANGHIHKHTHTHTHTHSDYMGGARLTLAVAGLRAACACDHQIELQGHDRTASPVRRTGITTRPRGPSYMLQGAHLRCRSHGQGRACRGVTDFGRGLGDVPASKRASDPPSSFVGYPAAWMWVTCSHTKRMGARTHPKISLKRSETPPPPSIRGSGSSRALLMKRSSISCPPDSRVRPMPRQRRPWSRRN